MDIYNDGPILVLAGAFDVRSTTEVRTALYDHLEEHDEDVVVDLSDVTHIDVTALRVLAVATRFAERAGHHLVLRGCRPTVRRFLHLTHMFRLVEVERPARRTA
jgi:anti-anti-sigma factor